MVPPQDGATRQFGVPEWCHPAVPEWCHPAVGLQQGRPQSPKQCHPSVPIAANLVPPASPEGPTGATRRFVTPVRLRQIQPGSPKQCHPAFRLNSATRQFGGIMRILGATPLFVFQDGATRQFAASVPRWGHPPDRARRIGRSLGPRPDLRGKRHQPGATRQFVTGRFGREARNSATPLFVFQDGATRQFARLCQDGATRRIGRVGSGDLWGHAPNCEAKAECESPNMVPPVSLPVSLPASVCRTFGATPPIRGAVVASSLRACPPRVAPVRPLLSPPGLHPPPLIVLAGDPELKSSRLKKLFTTSR